MGSCLCCGKQAQEDDEKASKAFEKGSDRDVSTGPVKNRGCTDVFCLIVFILHWFGFAAVIFVGVKDGEPSKLYKPRDFKGDYCDLGDFLGYENLMRTLNVSATVDEVAKQLICSTASQNALQVLLTNSEFYNYQCACCLIPCGACDSSLGLQDLNDPASAASTIGSRMSELTDPTKAGQLFSSGSSNMMSFSAESIWKEMTKFMVPVCMKDEIGCVYPEVTANTSGARSYVYTPTPTAAWKFAWDKLKDSPTAPAALQDTIKKKFTFVAMPESDCPYHPRYCIPFPGLAFKEASLGRCMPQVESNAAAALGSAAAEALENSGAEAMRTIQSGMGFFADMMSTVDAFCVTAFFSFVIGVVFMVLLRFLVGFVVWASLFLVAAALVIGGGLVYIRSVQCAGMGIFDTARQTGVALVTTSVSMAEDAVTGAETRSEAMTGNGEDYTGGQTRTKSGKLCQVWSSQMPHAHSYTPANYPNASLEQNYCRNPGGNAKTIWCLTTDTEKRWDSCTPVGVILPQCGSGYMVQDETMREVLKVVAYVIWALALIWVLAVCFLSKRIRLAIGVNKVAAMFVYNNPTVLGVPVVQIFLGFAWVLMWLVGASFLLSQVPEGYTPSQAFATYAEAYGTVDTPGVCTDKWPSGTVYKYEGDVTAANDSCTGVFGDISDIEPKCWKCYPPRYALDARFAYAFFSLLWNNAFLVALGQLIIAGAVANWFFTKDQDRGKIPCLRPSLRIAFRYHLGTVAFGAFILALVQFIRYCMKYLEKQAAAQKNRVMVLVLKVVQCCLWCFEKCIKFLNKNAYIQTALLGTNFCTSAKNAFQLIIRNMLRFGVVAILGTIISAIGWTVITVGTVGIGYLILQAFHPDAAPLFPMLSYFCIGYMGAMLFMNVFALAVDTSLQCFIACEEMKIAEEFVPGPLKSLVDSNPSKGEMPKISQVAPM